MENEWNHLMEQQFLLYEHGNITHNDLRTMTGEERQWWIDRINKQHEREKDAYDSAKHSNSGRIPSSPGNPPR